MLTHHERETLPMQGNTTFQFVTDGIQSALEQARTAAGDKDVSIAGGASTVNQYLAAGLLDELYLHIVPVVLGAGYSKTSAIRRSSRSRSSPRRRSRT